jgi:hypothetical protein
MQANFNEHSFFDSLSANCKSLWPKLSLLNHLNFFRIDSITKSLKIKEHTLQQELLELLKRFPHLISLDLHGNSLIHDLTELPNLTPRLEDLGVAACYLIQDFSFISKLKFLKKINLNCNQQIKELSFLEDLNIVDLSLRGFGCNVGKNCAIEFEIFNHFTSLEHLDLGWSNIRSSADLSLIPSQIKSLGIDYCFSFEQSVLDCSCLTHLINLNSLDLKSCYSI